MRMDVGDFVDVRCVAVGVDANTITVRIPGIAALHQIAIAPHLVQHVVIRTAEARAADPVCASYADRLPTPRRLPLARND